MKTIGLAIIPVLLLAGGCSIKQTVDAAKLSPEMKPEICMIAARGVRSGFTETYRSALQSKGFLVQELAPGSSPSSCPLSTTYTGTWKWDMALYMSYAEMRVYQNARQVGVAIYDSRSGSGRLDKFIDAETKLNELADQLFPTGAAGLGQAPVPVAVSSEEPTKTSKQQQLQELMNDHGVTYEEYQRRYKQIMEQ